MGVVIAITVSKIFAIAIGAIYIRALSTAHRLLLLQVVLAVITELTAWYLAAAYKANNMWVFNIYVIIEFWLLLMAGRGFIASRSVKTGIVYSIILISFIWTVEVFFQGFKKWPTKTVTIGCILIMIVYFKALFDQVLFSKMPPYKLSIFWLSLSLILFYGCVLPFMALYNFFSVYYAEISRVLQDYMINIVNFLRYPMMGIAFYLHAQEITKATKTKPGYVQ